MVKWVDNDVKRAWGFKAATRTYHIARTGCDMSIAGQFKNRKPATIETREAKRVPGCPPQSSNLYDISQVLAWLARSRRDVQEQVEWREQIPQILDQLEVQQGDLL